MNLYCYNINDKSLNNKHLFFISIIIIYKVFSLNKFF